MSESAEGIGGRKWSLGRELSSGNVCIMQGKFHMATLTEAPSSTPMDPCGKQVVHLLVTAPQLWAAANEFIRIAEAPLNQDDLQSAETAFETLKNMVAKAVGKIDWKDVLQS